MTDTRHRVTLPRPNRDGGSSIGSCSCGWSTTYRWGEFGDAKRSAVEHIENTSGSEAVDVSTFGAVEYMEGESL